MCSDRLDEENFLQCSQKNNQDSSTVGDCTFTYDLLASLIQQFNEQVLVVFPCLTALFDSRLIIT